VFGLEKLTYKWIVNPLLNQLSKGKEEANLENAAWLITAIKVIMITYLLVHLTFVIINGLMLYRLLVKKKRNKWNLIIPIVGLIIHLFIPYNLGEVFIDAIIGMFSKVSGFAMFFAFVGLILAVVSIVLYFSYKEEKEEEEEIEREDNN